MDEPKSETTADFMERRWRERMDADLAAIKGREAAVRAALEVPMDTVDIGQFTMGQLGLSPVVVDKAGRLWRHEPGRLTLIYGAFPSCRC